MSQSPDGDAEESGAEELLRYRNAWSALNRLIGEGRSFSGHERNCCFLNTGADRRAVPRFADVSAATGLDLEDDGRVVAVVDWDLDGDLDLWLANRTAPRVRLLRNDSPATRRWLALRLEGVTCNRDAIGARVEVALDGGSRSLIETLRAGDGYLSQSSKWMHFGLGSAAGIDHVTVRWPGGAPQTFTGVRPDRRYVLRQGRAAAEEWSPPSGRRHLQPGPVALPPAESASRTVLTGPVPLPEVRYLSRDGESVSLDRHRGTALLVSLWSDTCLPCVKELREWTRNERALRAAGLEILALNVDELDVPDADARAAALGRLARLGYPFLSGRATVELVDRLELFHRALVELQRPLPVPTSFLLDAQGRVAVIYKGRVPLDELLADVRLLGATPAARRASAVPFPGRWASEPFPADPRPIVQALELRDEREASRRYLERCLAIASTSGSGDAGMVLRSVRLLGDRLLADGEIAEAAGTFERLHTLAPRDGALHREAGIKLLLRGRAKEAAAHLARALESHPDDADLLYNLGLAELGLGRAGAARVHLEAALARKPDDLATLFHLSNALLAENDARGAVRHLRRALALRPGWPFAANNLAWILATHPDASMRDGAEAVRLAEAVTRADGGRRHATLATLAAAYAEAGRFDDAVAASQRAIDLAASQDSADVLGKLQARHELYRAGRAFRAGPFRSEGR